MTLLFILHYSNKENEPHHRVSIENPYVTRKKVLTATAAQLANSNPSRMSVPLANSNSSRTSSAASSAAPSSKPTSTSTATVARAEINEDSPTIKRISAATGCVSVEELLARDQQKVANKTTNGPMRTNGSKAATVGSTASIP